MAKRTFTKYPASYVKASKFEAEFYTKDAAGIGTIASTKVIIEADNLDEAMDKAYKLPESRRYDNVMVSSYTSDRLQVYMINAQVKIYKNRFNSDKHSYLSYPGDNEIYVSIKAPSENAARNYYCHNLWGNYCDTKGNLDPDGYWQFGRIIKSYPIGSGDGQYDATQGE